MLDALLGVVFFVGIVCLSIWFVLQIIKAKEMPDKLQKLDEELRKRGM